jgi:pimeloyl-ACP methyl ester carboxylesterase
MDAGTMHPGELVGGHAPVERRTLPARDRDDLHQPGAIEVGDRLGTDARCAGTAGCSEVLDGREQLTDAGDAAVHRLSHRVLDRYTLAANDGDMSMNLDVWNSHTRPKGTVVFVPGFMTESSDVASWRTPIVRYAEARGMCAQAVRWQSRQLLDLYPLFHAINRMTTADKLKVLAMLGTGAFVLGPAAVLSLAPISAVLGLQPMYLMNAIMVWRGAVSEADRVGKNPTWLLGLSRPLVVIGHSLGGRIALRIAERNITPVDRIVAMAPAVRASSIDCTAMSSFSARGKLSVVHSEDDHVLSILFRLGEASFDHAVGYSGAPSDWRGVTNYKVRSSHSDYDVLCYDLLTRLAN